MEHNELRFVLEQKACLQLRQLIAAITREVGVAKTTIWRCQIRQILGLCSIAQHAVTLRGFRFSMKPCHFKTKTNPHAFLNDESALPSYRPKKAQTATW
jgi:hypothetical protein